MRWGEWSEGKMPNFLLIIFYLSLSQSLAVESALASAVSMALFLSLFFSFSYALNDHCDRKGKIASRGSQRAAAVLAVLFLGGQSVLLFLPFLPMVIGFSMYALSASYSAKPVRLKERGLAGIIAPAAAQQTLPALLIFSLMPTSAITIILFTAFLTALGFRRIFEHQAKDFKADKNAGVSTHAHAIGISGAKKLAQFFGKFEQFSLLAVLAWMGWNSVLLLILPLLYVLLWFMFRDMREYTVYYMPRSFALYLVIILLMLTDIGYVLAVPLCLPFTYGLFIRPIRFIGDKI